MHIRSGKFGFRQSNLLLFGAALLVVALGVSELAKNHCMSASVA